MVNAFISLFLGLMIATVGVDVVYGAERFAFGVPMLADGIEYLTVMVGAYGLGEILMRLEKRFKSAPLAGGGKVATRFPQPARSLERPRHARPQFRIGMVLGTIPGRRSDDRILRIAMEPKPSTASVANSWAPAYQRALSLRRRLRPPR